MTTAFQDNWSQVFKRDIVKSIKLVKTRYIVFYKILNTINRFIFYISGSNDFGVNSIVDFNSNIWNIIL